MVEDRQPEVCSLQGGVWILVGQQEVLRLQVPEWVGTHLLEGACIALKTQLNADSKDMQDHRLLTDACESIALPNLHIYSMFTAGKLQGCNTTNMFPFNTKAKLKTSIKAVVRLVAPQILLWRGRHCAYLQEAADALLSGDAVSLGQAYHL